MTDLILDIGGVIVLREDGFLRTLARIHPFDISKAEALLRELNAESDLGLPFSDYVRRFNAAFGFDLSEEEFMRLKFDNLVINRPLIEFCRRNGSAFRTSILSDNYETNMRWLKKMIDLDDWTHKQIYSFEWGITKPHRKIFEIALHEIGAAPEACAFVDDLAPNVAAAAALGIKTVLFTDADTVLPKLREIFSLKHGA